MDIVQNKRNRRSLEPFSGDSPKKGSSYLYDRIYTWIAENRSGSRAIYLSNRTRSANLSPAEAAWLHRLLSNHTNNTEISILLNMPVSIRMAIQIYHDQANEKNMVRATRREPSELLVPNHMPGGKRRAILDVARDQLCIIFDVEEPNKEVDTCIGILSNLISEKDMESAEDATNRFVLCLLLSLRSNNPYIFCGADRVRVHIWKLADELLAPEYERKMYDWNSIMSPGIVAN